MTEQFDNKLMDIQTKFVEISWEYVNNNTDEIETIFIYCSIEDGTMTYYPFYKINGSICKIHELSDHSKKGYNTQSERTFELYSIGLDFLEELEEHFEEDDREVPTQIKMVFDTKTKKFDAKISYEIYHSNREDIMPEDILNNWLEEEKNKLATS